MHPSKCWATSTSRRLWEATLPADAQAVRLLLARVARRVQGDRSAASHLDSSPLVADSWERLLEGAGRNRLESALCRKYLLKQRWFGEEERKPPSHKDRSWLVALPDSNAVLALGEAQYEEGEPDAYLPLQHRRSARTAEKLRETIFRNATSRFLGYLQQRIWFLHDAQL